MITSTTEYTTTTRCHFRPRLGKRGFSRVTMRHGVSELGRGRRHALGIIFHDART